MERNEVFLKNFVSECSSVCYVASSAEVMYQIPAVLGEAFCVIDLQNDNSPLKPFLEILRFHNPPFKLLEENVYPLQLEAFATYIHEGTAKERTDFHVENEKKYEQQRTKNSIIKLLELLNGENSYIFLNSQTLNEASLEIIQELEKSSLKGKFVFCFDINRKEFNSRPVLSFIKTNCSKNNFLNGIQLEKKGGKDLPEAESQETPENLILNLHNAVSFLDCETAKKLAVTAAKQYQTMNISKETERKLFLKTAQAFYINNDFDNATSFFTTIIDDEIDDEYDLLAKLSLSKIYLNKEMLPLAQKYAVLVQNKLSTDKKSPFYALAVMFDYLSAIRNNSILESKYQQALELLEKAELPNNYVYCALHFPYQYITNIEKFPVFQNILDKCERIISEADNKQACATMYHWRAVLFTVQNDCDSSEKYLEKADKIRMELGEIDSIITSKNGLSVHLMRSSRFKEAYNILNDVSDKLFSTENFSCMLELLKNMSISAFYYHDYKKAEILFSEVMNAHQDFAVEIQLLSPFLPNTNDILVYQTVLDIFNNDFIHAEINCSVLEKAKEKLSQAEKPILKYIRACILLKYNNVEKADVEFKSAIKELEKNSHYDFSAAFFYYEYAAILSRFGFAEKSAEIFNEGLEFAKAKSLVYFFKNKKTYSLEEYLQSFKVLSDVKIGLEHLHRKAGLDFSILSLHNKITEYQFINKINSYNYGISNIKNYLGKISQSICEFLMVQAVSFAEFTDNKKWVNLNSFAQNSSKELILPEGVWTSLYENHRASDRLRIVYDADTELYFCDISRFDLKCAIIIVPANLQKISGSSLGVLNIVLSNIQSQLVMFRQNEKLAELAFTDPVTSVYNRKALTQHITLESERIERMNKRKGQIIQKSIAFIDINNFKYYNEHFGQAAGDLLLRCFSELLKKTLRRIDFICHYKDDEFVIVMSDTSNEEGERMCQRIYIELAKEEFFIPELKKFLNKDFDVPQGKEIVFSMGLCSNLDIDDPANLTEVLRNAGKALRYTQEHGKGGVANWAKIKSLG